MTGMPVFNASGQHLAYQACFPGSANPVIGFGDLILFGVPDRAALVGDGFLQLERPLGLVRGWWSSPSRGGPHPPLLEEKGQSEFQIPLAV